MANVEHLRVLSHGGDYWNKWRQDHDEELPDLSRAHLRGADLKWANLSHANFYGADLVGAKLEDATLSNANLSLANLAGADLSGAGLLGANLHVTYLNGTILIGARFGYTTLAGVDLSTAIGLEHAIHREPSSISVDTLYLSNGAIPEVFLRGVGLSDTFIQYIPSLLEQPIQFYSCFISYSHKDEEFARRLYSRMREADLRVWYAPEEMKGGRKLHEQIFNAIHLHDKLLLVLSEHSLRSGWVETEIRRARKAERDERRRKLFPIRLVDFEAIEKWECFDADSGKDLGVELREYFIPDFSNWKDHDAFEKGFARLLRDLKDDEEEKPESDPVSNDL